MRDWIRDRSLGVLFVSIFLVSWAAVNSPLMSMPVASIEAVVEP